MNRKTERRLSLSSEAGKALLVKNKCEQLKLEKKRRSLDRLQAYETVDFMNKKRELIDPRTSIHSWKTGDRHDSISHRITSAKPESDKNVDTYPKYRFRSQSQSLSGPNFVSSLVRSEDSLNSRRLVPSHSLNSHTRRSSSTFSQWSNGFCKCSPGERTAEINRRKSTANFELEEKLSSREQSIWKLLPPVQLIPFHKQKSRSLKELSSARSEVHCKFPGVKNVSWHDLTNCRYLRKRQDNSS